MKMSNNRNFGKTKNGAKGGIGGCLRPSVQKRSKIIKNSIETFEKYTETSKKHIRNVQEYTETFKNFGEFRLGAAGALFSVEEN